jgi:hypothetical protein
VPVEVEHVPQDGCESAPVHAHSITAVLPCIVVEEIAFDADQCGVFFCQPRPFGEVLSRRPRHSRAFNLNSGAGPFIELVLSHIDSATLLRVGIGGDLDRMDIGLVDATAAHRGAAQMQAGDGDVVAGDLKERMPFFAGLVDALGVGEQAWPASQFAALAL